MQNLHQLQWCLEARSKPLGNLTKTEVKRSASRQASNAVSSVDCETQLYMERDSEQVYIPFPIPLTAERNKRQYWEITTGQALKRQWCKDSLNWTSLLVQVHRTEAMVEEACHRTAYFTKESLFANLFSHLPPWRDTTISSDVPGSQLLLLGFTRYLSGAVVLT